eukprot:448322_1
MVPPHSNPTFPQYISQHLIHHIHDLFLYVIYLFYYLHNYYIYTFDCKHNPIQLSPNTTALAQPVDQNVGHELCELIRQPELRKLVAKWTHEAWKKLLLKEHLLNSAWNNCGLIDVWMKDNDAVVDECVGDEVVNNCNDAVVDECGDDESEDDDEIKDDDGEDFLDLTE